MPTITVHARTTAPADRVIAELTNFTDLERRLAVWPNLDRAHLSVHAVGPDWAEVTEGSGFVGGVWERLRYDWRTPGTVTLTVLDGNAFAAGGTWTYRIGAAPGGAEVHLTVHRVPAALKGRLLSIPLTLLGHRIFAADLRQSLQHIERDAPAPT